MDKSYPYGTWYVHAAVRQQAFHYQVKYLWYWKKGTRWLYNVKITSRRCSCFGYAISVWFCATWWFTWSFDWKKSDWACKNHCLTYIEHNEVGSTRKLARESWKSDSRTNRQLNTRNAKHIMGLELDYNCGANFSKHPASSHFLSLSLKNLFWSNRGWNRMCRYALYGSCRARYKQFGA